MFGIPMRLNPFCLVSVANRDKMEPDVAAFSLMLSLFPLSIVRSFHQSLTQWARNERRRKSSPYGLSPHYLLSTDSLIPLLPITNTDPYHKFQAIEPAISEAEVASIDNSPESGSDVADEIEYMEQQVVSTSPGPSPSKTLPRGSEQVIWQPCRGTNPEYRLM